MGCVCVCVWGGGGGEGKRGVTEWQVRALRRPGRKDREGRGPAPEQQLMESLRQWGPR